MTDFAFHLTWQEVIASEVSGMSALLIGHPLDTVKVLMQNTSGTNHYHTITREVLRCGLSSCFRGSLLPILAYTPVNFVMFSSYTVALNSLDGTSSDIGKIALAGAFSGSCRAIPHVPIEVIKIRLQKDASNSIRRDYSGPIDCFRKVLHKNGAKCLFTGFAANLAVDVIGASVLFTSSEVFYQYLMNSSDGTKDYLHKASGLAGAAAGMLSCGVVAPLDVVKTRVQALPRGELFQSYILKQIMIQGEMSRGLGALLFRAGLVNYITFSIYRRTLNSLPEEDDMPLRPF